jgi:hypothetical protein
MIRSGLTAGLLSLAFLSGMYVQAIRPPASAGPLPPLAICVTVTPAPFTTYTATPGGPAPMTTYTPTPVPPVPFTTVTATRADLDTDRVTLVHGR